MQDPNDDRGESRLYIGNLDLRITKASLLKLISPYGKIISEDFLWHMRSPKPGEPHGFAFIQLIAYISAMGQTSHSAKIDTIKNKLKPLEDESSRTKK
ncbi:hypothetical protein GYH30_022521 [Glycine max]|uniref:RRM domain-containing protein n=2 Tax=Glycine subgen. Soja TaxID=1462606 RepID=A0A0R0IT90_SOYBN|nr:hypothetical protein GYH30_022521 [Glycine max]RZB99017.1 hypothetical protein D0Y65_021763 [Glycine soja]